MCFRCARHPVVLVVGPAPCGAGGPNLGNHQNTPRIQNEEVYTTFIYACFYRAIPAGRQVAVHLPVPARCERPHGPGGLCAP